MDSWLQHQWPGHHWPHHRCGWQRMDLVHSETCANVSHGSCGGWWHSPCSSWDCPGVSELAVHSSRLRYAVGTRCDGSSSIDPGSWSYGQLHGGQPCFFHSQYGRHGRGIGGHGGGTTGLASRGCRRGTGRWKPRGCRAGVAWRRKCSAQQCRVESLGGCRGPVAAAGFDFAVREEEGQVEKVKEVPKEGQEVKKEEEERKAVQQFKQRIFAKQQVKIPNQQQLKQCFQWQDKAAEVGGEGKRSEGHLLQPFPRGATEAEKERRFDSICCKEPQRPYRALPGRGLCQTLQGNHQQVVPIERSQCGELGSSIQWFERGEGSQGSSHSMRDPRPCQPQRSGSSSRCFVPEDLGHPISEVQGRIMGEGRGVGAHQQPEDSGLEFHAGLDQRVRRGIRRSWRSMGGIVCRMLASKISTYGP